MAKGEGMFSTIKLDLIAMAVSPERD